jgi:hypothetical protein
LDTENTEVDKLHFTPKTIQNSGRVDIYRMFFATGKYFFLWYLKTPTSIKRKSCILH